MGSVSSTGKISNSYLYLGGIAGFLAYSNYDVVVKNCANYGDVTHSGKSYGSRVGGITGSSHSNLSPFNRAYIYNSLNYGAITYSGITSSSLYLGGIAGYSGYTTIEDCVSAGKISSNKANYIGGIAGYVYSNSASITHFFWTSDVGCDVANGTGSPEVTDTCLIVTLNTTTMN